MQTNYEKALLAAGSLGLNAVSEEASNEVATQICTELVPILALIEILEHVSYDGEASPEKQKYSLGGDNVTDQVNDARAGVMNIKRISAAMRGWIGA
jgi:hypothetical protein